MKYIVTYIDYGDTTDGLPGCLDKVFDTKEEAQKAMEGDVYTYNETFDDTFEIREGYAIVGTLGESGCGWRICEVKDGQ